MKQKLKERIQWAEMVSRRGHQRLWVARDKIGGKRRSDNVPHVFFFKFIFFKSMFEISGLWTKFASSLVLLF